MNQLWLRLRRWHYRRRDIREPLARLMNADMPSPATRFEKAEFVALDIETTGLDAATAEMLSVGWVIVRRGRVDLESAESHIVRPSGDVGSSASVHGLTDTIVGAGGDRSMVIDRIVSVLNGRALLVHHADLDKSLLDRLCFEQFGAPLLVPVVDTLALELRRQQRRHHVDEKRSLRLPDLRDAYNLPRYNAHDSLVDAIATAELLIAMVAHNDGMKTTCVRDLVTA